MRTLTMRSFSTAWYFIESGFLRISDKLSDFSWHQYSFKLREARLLLDFQTQILLDVFCQSIIDFCMPRYRLLLSCSRIDVDIVSGAVTIQRATLVRELPNELTTFHTAISLV